MHIIHKKGRKGLKAMQREHIFHFIFDDAIYADPLTYLSNINEFCLQRSFHNVISCSTNQHLAIGTTRIHQGYGTYAASILWEL